MFRVLRFLGSAALWFGAVLGVLAGAVWLATTAGVIQPLIVISGSMEPAIETGDLLIATKADTADLEVGDVVSLPSDLTQKLVTHRIVAITALDANRWEIEMKGDANPTVDIAPYVVGDQVWKPGPHIPGVGYTVSTLMRPGFVMPAMLALVALLGFSLLSEDEDDDDDDDPVGHDSDHDVGRSQPDDEPLVPAWPPPKVLETASR